MEPTPLQDQEHKTPVQEFTGDVKAFWDRFGLSILVVILAVLVLLLATRYFKGREQRALEAAYGDLAAAQSPFEMADVANRYEHMPAFSGYALLEAGAATLREALGLQLTIGGTPISEADRVKALERAAELYGRVIKLNASTLQVLNARMGLAAVLESQGKFDEAAAQYQTIQKEAGETWAVIGDRARIRSGELEKLKVPIVFPDPKTPPATDAKPANELELKPTELLPEAKEPPAAEESEPKP